MVNVGLLLELSGERFPDILCRGSGVEIPSGGQWLGLDNPISLGYFVNRFSRGDLKEGEMAEVKMWDVVPGFDLDEEVDLKDISSWFLDGAHSIPAWTPMFAWFWIKCCSHGLKYGEGHYLSFPTCKGYEMRHKDGHDYCAFAIVKDEEEIKRREVKFREALRPFIEDFDGIWKGYLDEIMEIYEPLKSLDLDKATNIELLYHLWDLIRMYYRMWEIHFIPMYASANAWILLEGLCKDWFGITDTSPEFQKLLIGFDNKVFQVDKRLWQFSKLAINKGLADIFQTTEAKEVILKLEQIEAGREWLKEFREFLWKDGWRMQRVAEINEPTWIEDPTPAISAAKGFLAKGGGFDLDEIRERLAKEREEAVTAMLQKVPEEQRDWFAGLIALAQKWGSYSEEHDHYLDLYAHALIRRGLLGIGRRLVQAGSIDRPDDTFFLIPDEIERVMHNPEFFNLRHIVNRRRKEWEGWLQKESPPVITTRSGLQEAVEKDLLPSWDATAMKLIVGEMPVVRPELKADLYGVGGSVGVAEGPARVITSYEQIGEVQPGEILVAPATAPTWNPVFALIKGAVIDRGGTLTHPCIVGREYGIPVVINVFEGTTKIKTGQRLRVDGNLGVVYILEKGE